MFAIIMYLFFLIFYRLHIHTRVCKCIMRQVTEFKVLTRMTVIAISGFILYVTKGNFLTNEFKEMVKSDIEEESNVYRALENKFTEKAMKR